MKKFTLIGVSGYIAPRHLKAIKENNCELVAALDPSDSVGILDSFFPLCDYFSKFEIFDRHLDKLRTEKNIKIDFMSICSPNHFHDAHIRFALRNQSNAICEKPLVLNPWNAERLLKIEESTGKKIYNVLQLRLHKTIIELKNKIELLSANKKSDVTLTYITSRGSCYHHSWKGDASKSGGIATNIGIHFFDMLSWIFGKVQQNIVSKNDQDVSSGFLEFEKARVKWFLSTNENYLPENVKKDKIKTFRSMIVNGEEVEFSKGFTDLHTDIYRNIIEGNGFGIKEALPSIEIASKIRSFRGFKKINDLHPFLTKKL